VLPIAEFGSGAPLIVVPGIQGRWEYVRPAVEALAAHFHVITFALAGEPASGLTFDTARGLDNYADQIARVMDERGLERAAVCGISFGGLGALRFAASAPGRVSALVLVSTPGPGWRQARRHAFYARFPWLCMPLFVAETPLRLHREITRAIPRWRARAAFSIDQTVNLMTAPISVASLAERARILDRIDVAGDCARVSGATLIITGEHELDRIVPVAGTAGYAELIAGARLASIANTGHLGCNTQPAEFANIVRTFVEKRDHAAA
jgi:pimeloyl-ACP methyl ester carboxylesterase